MAFVAPIIGGANGPQNGDAAPLLGWKAQPCSQIKAFSFNGAPWPLLCRQDGSAPVAPLTPTESGMQIGDLHQIGPWEANWAELAILSFLWGGLLD